MSVLAALTISAMGSNYHQQNMIPDRLLATSPRPQEHGVVWQSRSPVGNRSPIAERRYGDAGPARYGAPADAADDLVYVRVNHVVIAISPWEQFTEQGHQKLERARTLWLKERGLVGGVRTHVNPAYAIDRDAEVEPAPATEVQPRAILHIRERVPANNGPMRAEATPRFKVVVPGETEMAQADDQTDAG